LLPISIFSLRRRYFFSTGKLFALFSSLFHGSLSWLNGLTCGMPNGEVLTTTTVHAAGCSSAAGSAEGRAGGRCSAAGTVGNFRRAKEAATGAACGGATGCAGRQHYHVWAACFVWRRHLRRSCFYSALFRATAAWAALTPGRGVSLAAAFTNTACCRCGLPQHVATLREHSVLHTVPLNRSSALARWATATCWSESVWFAFALLPLRLRSLLFTLPLLLRSFTF